MIRAAAELFARILHVGSLDLGSASPFPPADYTGDMWTVGLMGNLYLDLPAAGRMQPYLGVGYGISQVTVQYNQAVCFIFCFSTDNEVASDYDVVRARQAMIGASFAGDSPGMEWHLGYRYFETEDLDFTTLSGVPFGHEGIRTHTVLLGMRFLI